jgi:hypothetical protein
VSAGRVHGRREQLARVVRNLLDNADRHARTMVAIQLHNDAESATVELMVDDDGPGIPVEDRERCSTGSPASTTGAPATPAASARPLDGADHRRAARGHGHDRRCADRRRPDHSEPAAV